MLNRRFQMMVKDHTAINDDLKALAVQKGRERSAVAWIQTSGVVDKMAALTGSAFDDAYVERMIKGPHQGCEGVQRGSCRDERRGHQELRDKFNSGWRPFEAASRP